MSICLFVINMFLYEYMIINTSSLFLGGICTYRYARSFSARGQTLVLGPRGDDKENNAGHFVRPTANKV